MVYIMFLLGSAALNSHRYFLQKVREKMVFHIFIISSVLYSFLNTWVPCWLHLSSNWRILFSISCRAGSMATNSLRVFFFCKCLYFTFILKEYFPRLRIQADLFFLSLSTLKMLFHCLWPPKIRSVCSF